MKEKEGRKMKLLGVDVQSCDAIVQCKSGEGWLDYVTIKDETDCIEATRLLLREPQDFRIIARYQFDQTKESVYYEGIGRWIPFENSYRRGKA